MPGVLVMTVCLEGFFLIIRSWRLLSRLSYSDVGIDMNECSICEADFKTVK